MSAEIIDLVKGSLIDLCLKLERDSSCVYSSNVRQFFQLVRQSFSGYGTSEKIYSAKDCVPIEIHHRITGNFIRIYPYLQVLHKNKELICNLAEFKPLKIVLGDNNIVIVSQQFMIKYSDMVKTMFSHKMSEKKDLIYLPQLNIENFHILISFLETNDEVLLDSENVIPLFAALTYLQISHLKEEIKKKMMSLDIPICDIPIIINELDRIKDKDLIDWLEGKISQYFAKICNEPEVSGESLKAFQKLKERLLYPIHINISGSKVDNDKLQLLEGLHLHTISLNQCSRLNSDALSFLNHFPHLKKIEIAGNDWVDDQALLNLPQKTENLNLYLCKKYTNKGLDSLKRMQIKHLKLTCFQFNDEDLSKLPDLESLKIQSWNGIGTTTMDRIHRMPNLKKLDLSHCRLPGEYLCLLPSSIEHLNLSCTGITDNGIKRLYHLKHLHTLFLKGLNITGAYLSSLISLQLIEFYECYPLEDPHLISLLKIPFLKRVILGCCPKISQMAKDKLKEKIDLIE